MSLLDRLKSKSSGDASKASPDPRLAVIRSSEPLVPGHHVARPAVESGALVLRVESARKRPALSERTAVVDDLLRGDAAHAPAFALARRAVIADILESQEPVTRRQIADVLAGLLAYEDARGGLSAPREGASKVAARFGVWERQLRVYERARAHC